MSYELPQTLLGTLRVRPAARGRLLNLLDTAPTKRPGVLVTEGSTWVWDTLRQNRRWQRWEVCALVPHVAGYVREATDYGMFGAGWRRLRRTNPFSWGRLCLQGLRHAGGVLRRDFPTLLTMLLEMEMASFRRVSPPVVFLHPQITDLLLAMDHGVALERAIERICQGFRAEPGLATNNLGTLLPRLQEWGLDVPYLLAPMHPHGYGMRPSQQRCEESLRAFRGKIVAVLDSDFDAGVAAYWQMQGVASALYDAPEPRLAQWEQWRGWHSGESHRVPERTHEILFT